ncbi:hypothetical protein COO60DRAFT_1486783, partial [Scenedesmus sp. NREL 46B-D3]
AYAHTLLTQVNMYVLLLLQSTRLHPSQLVSACDTPQHLHLTCCQAAKLLKHECMSMLRDVHLSSMSPQCRARFCSSTIKRMAAAVPQHALSQQRSATSGGHTTAGPAVKIKAVIRTPADVQLAAHSLAMCHHIQQSSTQTRTFAEHTSVHSAKVQDARCCGWQAACNTLHFTLLYMLHPSRSGSPIQEPTRGS